MAAVEKRIARRSRRTIFSALLRAHWRYGRNREVLIDADGRRMTYTDILRAAFGLGRAISRHTGRGEKVGVLLPTGAGAVISFFAIHAAGRVPAMLNFTAGPLNLEQACRAAEVSKIITAHQFIKVANLEKLEGQLQEIAQLIYIEELRETMTIGDKIAAVVGPILPWLVRINPKPSEPGVILFTSGTEGAPKGVVLSHTNVIANVEQINAHVDLEPTDIIFNPLPTFHCYGLTAGTLFPILTGRSLVLHPSPLQTKMIPQRISETGATILFATDTFLQQYARASKEDGLSSLRFAVCGAERVRDETRAFVKKKFDFEVLEGYGVTEAAPVLAANQPGDIRSGTVGHMLPSIESRLEPVEGIEGVGRLFVRGPNIMTGYLSVDRPGEIVAPEDGWYDTGDVVSIDEHGYISIRDRVKRFAKIGGEMVSLSVVENCASAIWPDHQHAAVTAPDARKGEQIILVTTCAEADRDRLRTWMQSHGVSALTVPKRLVVVDEIPVLGTGKTDFASVREMAFAEQEEIASEGVPVEPTSEAESQEPRESQDPREPGSAEIITPEAETDKDTGTDLNETPEDGDGDYSI